MVRVRIPRSSQAAGDTKQTCAKRGFTWSWTLSGARAVTALASGKERTTIVDYSQHTAGFTNERHLNLVMDSGKIPSSA